MSDSKPYSVPRRDEVQLLMKKCQMGFGGREVLNNANDVLAECYGLLGLLMHCMEFYQARATCSCGDEFTVDDPGTCGACLAVETSGRAK